MKLKHQQKTNNFTVNKLQTYVKKPTNESQKNHKSLLGLHFQDTTHHSLYLS